MSETLRTSPGATEHPMWTAVRNIITWSSGMTREGMLALKLALPPALIATTPIADGQVHAQTTETLPMTNTLQQKNLSSTIPTRPTPDLSPNGIMKLIHGLGSGYHGKREVSTKILETHFNRDIMTLVATEESSEEDLERKRRLQDLLPDAKFGESIQKFDPLPAYLKDQWLWLPPEKERVFKMTAISGLKKGQDLRFDEVSQIYRWNMKLYPESYYDLEWRGDYGDQRRAMWYLCQEKRDLKARELLKPPNSHLKKLWQESKSPEDFPTWKINRYRTGMQEEIEEINAFALPFAIETKKWREKERGYKRTNPPLYPPSMDPLQKKSSLPIRPSETISVVDSSLDRGAQK